MGIGSVFGVLLSIIILSLRTDSVQLILFVLIFLIICAWVFIQNYFDNDHEVFNLWTVKNLNIVEKTKNLEQNTVFLFQKYRLYARFPETQRIDGLHHHEAKRNNKRDRLGRDYAKNQNRIQDALQAHLCESTTFVPILLWSTGIYRIVRLLGYDCDDIFCYFSRWISEKLGSQNIIRSGFILIGVLAVPAYAFQIILDKKSKIYGKFNIITLGILSQQ
jgi:hypothetical protein